MTARKPTTKGVKRQLEEIHDKFRLTALTRAQKLMEMQNASDFWLTSYVDILDRYRDGGQVVYPISNPNDRRAGSNFPFWMSESQLSIIRASSRLIVTMNPAAYGLLNGLTSYVIGSGFTYRAVPIEGMEADEKLVRAVQKAIDRFIEENSWKEMEQELFFRSREDGECFLRMFPQQSGVLQVRTVEPEQVIQPPNSTFEEWSYGIQTERDDLFDIKAYFVHYMAPGGVKMEDGVTGEVVDAEDMIHIKANVKRAIKRGLPDLSFDTLETFSLASKLRRNMGEGAAVQAAIAAVRQHDTASASQVETFVQQAIDYSLNIPFNGRQQDYTKIDAGSFLDIPKGMNYIPPPGAANANAHLAIHSALLRAAGTRHNAPEWLVSGDASNNNYASSLTAESPFLRNCQRLQSFMSRSFKRVMVTAVKNSIAAGRLPSNALKMVEVTVSPPTVETRNRAEEANSNKTYVEMGVKSRQRVAQELGYDWKKEAAEIEDYNEKFGQKGQQGGPPQGPQGPGPEGPGGPGAPKAPPQQPKEQQAQESIEEGEKPGLWANIRDKRKRGEPPAKPGDEDYPDEKSYQAAQESEGGRYSHIDFTPPEGARNAAKRALEVRAEKPESQRGMTAVGIARARDLARGAKLSPETVRRMKAFFDRHEVDKKGSTWGEKGKGWQAWMGWGGDPGYAWARKVVRQMDSADDVTEGLVEDLNEAKSDEEGRWVTLHGDSMHGGVHVFLKPSGEISKGPKSLIGKKPSEIKTSKSDNFGDEKKASVLPSSGKTETPIAGISFSSEPAAPSAKKKAEKKPKAKPKAPAEPSKEEPKAEEPQKEPTQPKEGIPHPSELKTQSSLGGSTGAYLKTDNEGNKFVEKGGSSPEHIRSEHLADKIYQAAGVSVPDAALHETDKGPRKVSKHISGTPLSDLSGEAKQKAIDDLKKNFATDALLANWDVVGLNQDNILVDKNGTAHRIDNGGSLKFRAMGKPKEFGPVASEIDSMRTSPQGKAVFGSLTDKEIADQVKDLVGKKDAIIDAAKKHGASQDIVDNLGKRIDGLKDRFLGKEELTKEPVDKGELTKAPEKKFMTPEEGMKAYQDAVNKKAEEIMSNPMATSMPTSAYGMASKQIKRMQFPVKHEVPDEPRQFKNELEAALAFKHDFDMKKVEYYHNHDDTDSFNASEYAKNQLKPENYQYDPSAKNTQDKNFQSDKHAFKELINATQAIHEFQKMKNPEKYEEMYEIQKKLGPTFAMKFDKPIEELTAPASHGDWQFKPDQLREQVIGEPNADKVGMKIGSKVVNFDSRNKIQDYSTSPSINKRLWDQGDNPTFSQPHDELTYKSIAKGIEDAGELPEPITVWRGMSFDIAKHIGKPDYKSLVGETIEMPGFQSTSLNPSVAVGFHNKWNTTKVPMFEIKTNRGIFMDKGLSSLPEEHEFLMGHNWKYRVVGYEKGVPFPLGDGQITKKDILKLELV